LEADVGGYLEKTGRKAEISSDFIVAVSGKIAFIRLILNKFMA